VTLPARLEGAPEVQVIMNADDLGMSREVNEAIFDLMARGRVTSASLLANAPATEEAIRTIPKFPQCSFGAHLNITEYEPLCRAAELSELLDGEGKLRPIPPGFRFTLTTLRAVYLEFSAQIQKLLLAGIRVSHLDSHMHLHLRLALFPLSKVVQRTYDIRRIRTRYDLVAAGQHRGWQQRANTHVYNWAMRHVYNSVTADSGAELATFIAAEWERHPRFRTVEAMAHPGNPYYPGDIALLRSPWEEALPFPVRLINYHQLS
jgi:predicted glycoside hydrolase/deacetylase ChbG (UPF0249 family)